MQTFTVLLSLSLVFSGYAFSLWKWRDCSDPRTRILYMENFDLSPKPLSIPGYATITMMGNISHSLLANSHYSLDVKMDKKLLGRWHPVPCHLNFGTCKYDDPCEYLQRIAKNHTCLDAFINHDLSCTCPFNPVAFNIKQIGIHLPAIPQWQFIMTGDFRVNVKVLSAGTMIGCFEVEFSILTPCTGFLCGGQ